MLLWLVLIVFGVRPWVRPELGVCVATVWHVTCGQFACEGAGMRDDMAADKYNEPWTKLEKRYKEYRNPVLILTPGLQTRLCCRFVENHVLKEWHCWAAAAPKAGLTLSTVSAQRCRAALVPAHLGQTEATPGSLPSSPSTRGAGWRGHGQRGAAAQGLAEALLLGMTWLVYASSSPADTISRMATGRWSVRPDSWVIKLNSSTSAFQSGHSPSSAYSM